MILELTGLYLLGGRSSKKLQQAQIAQTQKQIALAQAQHVMQEDLVAITAAPVEQRAAILQARIAARNRMTLGQQFAAVFWLIVIAFGFYVYACIKAGVDVAGHPLPVH